MLTEFKSKHDSLMIGVMVDGKKELVKFHGGHVLVGDAIAEALKADKHCGKDFTLVTAVAKTPEAEKPEAEKEEVKEAIYTHHKKQRAAYDSKG
jgi:hypothetical protein